MSALKWLAGLTIALSTTAGVLQGCGSKKASLAGDDGTNPTGGGDDGGTGTSSGTGFGGSSGFSSGGGSGSSGGPDNSACKGGLYEGTFAGIYDSHIALAFGIPVTGDVNLTLEQEGDAGTCVIAGEIPKPCNEVYTLKNGTITGTADEAKFGDSGALGGFPYHCDLTGTLDCQTKQLVNGWITCTYCVGPIEDGGHACVLGNGVGRTTGTGGHFAGPLIANYDTGTLSFVMGTWNGAEALCTEGNGTFTCNDGTMPGPDGGPWQNYISDAGAAGYIFGTSYGGSGTWNATYQK